MTGRGARFGFDTTGEAIAAGWAASDAFALLAASAAAVIAVLIAEATEKSAELKESGSKQRNAHGGEKVQAHSQPGGIDVLFWRCAVEVHVVTGPISAQKGIFRVACGIMPGSAAKRCCKSL